MATLDEVQLEMLSDKLSLKVGSEQIYSQPQPLLLLSYLALKGKTLRSELTRLFWAHIADNNRARAYLSEVLRLLKKIEHPSLSPLIRVEESANPRDSYLITEVDSDVAKLHQAIAENDIEKILQLYQRPLLWQLETKRRLHLDSGDLHHWLITTRENLANKTRDAVLSAAERIATQEKYTRAAHLAQKAWRQITTDITVLSVEEYQRIQRLFLAHSSHNAASIREEARRHGLQIEFATNKAHARASLSSSNNLPATTSELVGRQEIYNDVHHYLRQGSKRCVNLLGMAGIGKSKLALHIARDLRGYSSFQDGIFVVWLQNVKKSSAMIDAIAQSLELKGHTLQEVGEALQHKAMLLLLDNLEDIIADDSQVLDDLHTLLNKCLELRILVTSRSKLGSPWEKCYTLEGIDYRAEKEAILLSAAGQLWLEQGVPRPQPEDYSALQEIFTFSQGNPLAIKLAARCSESQSIQSIAREFKRQLHTVTLNYGRLNNFNLQHQSLVIAFENSWRQLNSLEQAQYLPLALFESSMRLEMLRIDFALSQESLSRFCQRNLLRWQSDSKRYHLHPLLRQFALEKLEQSPHKQQWQKTYYDYFSQELLAVAYGTQEERNDAPKKLASELSNIAKTWHWQLEQENYAFLDKGAHALEQLYDLLGQARVGKTLLQIAEQKLTRLVKTELQNSQRQHAYVNILASLAWLCKQSAQYKEAATLAEKARELAEVWQHERALSTALNTLGAVYDMCGQFTKAQRYVMESLQRKKVGSSEYANVLSNLAQIDIQLGNYQQAKQRLNQALAIFTQQQRYLKIVQCHFKLARLAFYQQEDTQQLQEQFNLVMLLAQQHAAPIWLHKCYFYQGILACLTENYQEAHEYSRQLRHLAKQYPQLRLERMLLDMNIYLYKPSKVINVTSLFQSALTLAKRHHSLVSIFRVLVLQCKYREKTQQNSKHLARFFLLYQAKIPHYLRKELQDKKFYPAG